MSDFEHLADVDDLPDGALLGVAIGRRAGLPVQPRGTSAPWATCARTRSF